MTSVGVRELRQRASELLRRVEAGETIEVTDRGRPVALLTPVPDAGPLGAPACRRRGDVARGRPGRAAGAAAARARAGARPRSCSSGCGAMSAERATYLDSSAIVKLVIVEPESAALRRYLRLRRPLVSSALARAEVARALLPLGEQAVRRGQEVLGRLELIRVSDRILAAAGQLLPAELRTLEAIHLATALELGLRSRAGRHLRRTASCRHSRPAVRSPRLASETARPVACQRTTSCCIAQSAAAARVETPILL